MRFLNVAQKSQFFVAHLIVVMEPNPASQRVLAGTMQNEAPLILFNVVLLRHYIELAASPIIESNTHRIFRGNVQ